MFGKKCSAPSDISDKNVAGKCDKKCEYFYSYASNVTTVTHRVTYLWLKQTETTPAVFFNGEGYSTSGARLYCPSLHTYDGAQADAELLIEHTSLSGADTLLVCVPVRAAMLSKSALDDVVAAAAKDASSIEETATVGSLSLGTFIPSAPGATMYSYTGTTPWLPCENTVVNYLVFKNTASCSVAIGSAALATLQKLVNPTLARLPVVAAKLFTSTTGAQPGGGGGGGGGNLDGDVYMDCQPVSASDDTTLIVTDNNDDTTTDSSTAKKKKTRWYDIGLPLITGFLMLLVICSFMANGLLPMPPGFSSGAASKEADKVGGGARGKRAS